jgi:hypothetical protein
MNTPKHCSDDTINALWEDGPELPSDVSLFEVAVAITRQNAKAHTIDLTQRYKIKVERLPTLYRLNQFAATDELTFDPDPESHWHLVGIGETESDAKLDLLEKIADAKANAADLIQFKANVHRAHREATSRRLAEIDPDWEDHYKTLEAAEMAYWRELQAKP